LEEALSGIAMTLPLLMSYIRAFKEAQPGVGSQQGRPSGDNTSGNSNVSESINIKTKDANETERIKIEDINESGLINAKDVTVTETTKTKDNNPPEHIKTEDAEDARDDAAVHQYIEIE
jgi:hypothetical protein